MARDVTSIEVRRSTWKELNRRKEPGDSFDDVISGLLADSGGGSPDRVDEAVPTQEPAFECPACSERYPSYEAMRQHMEATGH